MARVTGWLDQVRVASPCKASWDSMEGDERARTCGECRLQVFNLSGMSRAEAEAFVAGASLRAGGGERVCVRFYRRSDGTVLTQDCPAGLRSARERMPALAGRLAALLAMTGLAGSFSGCRPRDGILRGSVFREVEPLKTLLAWADPEPPGPALPRRRFPGAWRGPVMELLADSAPAMGEMAAPAPPPSP